MRVQVRMLGESDAETFMRLRLEALLDSPTAFSSSYEEELGDPMSKVAGILSSANGCVVGAFDGDRLVGITGVQRESAKKLAHKGWIWGVYVTPDYRGRGISGRMMYEAIIYARDTMGLKKLNLGVNTFNEPAKAVYEAMGFVPFGLESGYMIVEGASQDEVLMHLQF